MTEKTEPPSHETNHQIVSNELVSEMDFPRSPEIINADVLPPDKISNLTFRIDNIKFKSEAFSRVAELQRIEVLTYLELGGVLWRIKNVGWLDGHTSFSELCKKQFGMCTRNADYLINTHNWTIDANLTWEQIKNVHWSKMRLLPGKVDHSNAIEWVDKARQLTVKELTTELALLSYSPPSEDAENSIDSSGPQEITSETITPETACLMQTSDETLKASLMMEAHSLAIDWMREVGPDVVREVFNSVFPESELTTISSQ